jgi:hypothetical protein
MTVPRFSSRQCPAAPFCGGVHSTTSIGSSKRNRPMPVLALKLVCRPLGAGVVTSIVVRGTYRACRGQSTMRFHAASGDSEVSCETTKGALPTASR